VEAWFDSLQVMRENARLREYLRDARLRVIRMDEVRRENARLRSLLNLGLPEGIEVGGIAEVISWDPTGWDRMVVLDIGSTHGIGPGLTALAPEGLLGRVVSVTATTSRVLLLTDVRSAVAVRLQDSRTNAVLEGTAQRDAQLLYVPRDTPVAVGEMVVTSGLDQVFPRGIPVGTVFSVEPDEGGMFLRVLVRLSADIGSQETVVLAAQIPGKRP